MSDWSPPELPPNGDLLARLGYLDEMRAALALDLSPQTLRDYRKLGIGPDFAVCGRAILYSPDNLKKWLDSGGTRASIESGAPLVRSPLAKRTKRELKRVVQA